MANNTWQVNGVYLPRSPADFDFKPAKANVSYVDLLDGSIRRQRLARKIGSRQFKMMWGAVDSVVRRQIMKTFVQDSLNTIVLTGTQPLRQLSAWFDDFDMPLVKEGYESRPGFGGFREDLTLTGQTPDGWFSSVTAIPFGLGTGFAAPGGGALESTAPDGGHDFGTLQSVVNNFLGPSGSAADGLPIWTNNVAAGQAWTRRISGAMSDADQVFHFLNLGDAEWLPVITWSNKIIPIAGRQWKLNIAVDVDGTGGGVDFVWYGNNLGNGDTLTFNTKTLRAYLNGTETQAFNVVTHTDGLPFAYWPAMLPGSTQLTMKNVHVAVVLADGVAATALDLSNNGTELFRYI